MSTWNTTVVPAVLAKTAPTTPVPEGLLSSINAACIGAQAPSKGGASDTEEGAKLINENTESHTGHQVSVKLIDYGGISHHLF